MHLRHSGGVNLDASLRAFVAVARCHSFSQAAELERTTQPVMSRRVAALEASVGGALLERSSRRVGLTPLGRSLLPHARRVIAAQDSFVEAATAHRRSAVRVLVPPHLDPVGWSRVVLGARARDRRVECVEGPRLERAARLAEGDVEAAVVHAEGRRPDWRVTLGLAHDESDEASPRSLRPTRAGRHARVDLLVTEEDAEPGQLAALVRGVTDLGLGAGQVEVVDNLVSALARVVAGEARIVCSRAQAAGWGLAWTPTPELGLERRYRLGHTGPAATAGLDDDVVRAIGTALGAEGSA